MVIRQVQKCKSSLVVAARVLLCLATTRQVLELGGRSEVKMASQSMDQSPVQQTAWLGMAVTDLETGTPTAQLRQTVMAPG